MYISFPTSILSVENFNFNLNYFLLFTRFSVVVNWRFSSGTQVLYASRNISICQHYDIFIAGTTCIALFLQLRSRQKDLGAATFALKLFTRNNPALLIPVIFFHQKSCNVLTFLSLLSFEIFVSLCNYIIRIKCRK